MEEFPSEMPLSELDAARQELNDGELEDELREIVEQLQKMETAAALDRQQSAREKMDGLTQKLQQMQDALRANQQREIVDALQRSLQDMLELSKRQEQLKNEARSLQQNSQQFRGLAQQQMELMRDLSTLTSRLASLSQKTFGITPEMGQAIGDAMRGMNEALGSLERRNGSAAGEQQSSAMASLNEAAQMLQWSLNAMMQGGQGVGMAGFMQGLQRLTGQQQGINSGTQQLDGMTRQQAAALARLAGEQGAVRKSLEQLAREAAGAGQLSKLLGDLNRIAREMREVQTDLAQGNVNPETLRKQERILSRLLDSQRSLRERDYERRRRAESGTNVARVSPGRIDLSSQESRNRLREDLLKALQEGYARDYEELIKRYFEVLEQ
jgi:DNA repair exonuclease SbcCD ATPase subunit